MKLRSTKKIYSLKTNKVTQIYNKTKHCILHMFSYRYFKWVDMSVRLSPGKSFKCTCKYFCSRLRHHNQHANTHCTDVEYCIN